MFRRKSVWVLAVAGAVVVAALAGGYGYLHESRNHVDLVGRLDADRPLGARVQGLLDAEGRDAALAALAEHFIERSAPATLQPAQLWKYDPEFYVEQARGFVGGRLPNTDIEWQPGDRLGWGAPTRRSVLFRLQRQAWLLRTAAAAPPDIERDVLLRARAFIAEWRRANPVWPNPNDYAWNDDATSNRIEAQIFVMQRLRDLGMSDPATELEFLRSLVQHADRLMDDEEHNYRSNHGLMQNGALLSIAVSYPELDEGRRWRRTALERTERHLRETVTDDGVFLELAPGYHWFATFKILWFIRQAERAGIEIDASMREKTRAMVAFCREVLYPDRSLPMISDTNGDEADVDRWPWPELPDWPELAELRSAMAPDPVTPPNEPGAQVRPDAGYFLLRVPAPVWTVDQGMMLTFMAGPLSRAHVHRDALSLTLFGDGRPLLTGPGYPSYSQKEMRQQLIGTPSQNALSVGGEPHPAGAARVSLEDLRARGTVPDLAVVQGESSLYEGVLHRRTVVYGPSSRGIVILDTVESSDEHVYTRHFRVAAGLQSELNEHGVRLFDPQAPSLSLLTIREVEGFAPGPATWSPAGPVHGLSVTGRSTTFVTHLQLGETDDASISIEGDRLIWVGDRGRFTTRLPLQSTEDYEWRGKQAAIATCSDVESSATTNRRPERACTTTPTSA